MAAGPLGAVPALPIAPALSVLGEAWISRSKPLSRLTLDSDPENSLDLRTHSNLYNGSLERLAH